MASSYARSGPSTKVAATPRSQDEESKSSDTANHASDNPASDEDEELEDDEDDDFLAHQTSSRAEASAGKRKDVSSRASHSPANTSGEKRRRTTRGSINPNPIHQAPGPQPRTATTASSDRFRPPPLQVHGFAAGRQSRRQSGGYGDSIPSPVVMGFDYKNVDADQLKTVSTNTNSNTTPLPQRRVTVPFQPLVVPATPSPRRFTSHLSSQVAKNQAEAIQVQTTLTIKEQQEALIAQRRLEAANNHTSEPKQLEFRNWQPPVAGERVKSMRRPPGQGPAAHLTVHTPRSEDVMAGIRSAPLGASLAAQQSGRPGMLPPIQSRNGHLPPSSDLRATTVDRPIEGGERPQFYRPSSGRYEVMPHTARPAPLDRRSFTGPIGPPHQHDQGGQGPAHHPSSSSLPSPPRTGPHNGMPASASAARRDFLAPFERLYEVLSSTESLKYVLTDLHHRYEATLSAKAKEIGDFKATTHAASTLLNNLQQSTDSLKDMVRYEIARAGNAPASAPPASAGAPAPTPATTTSGGLNSEERKEFEEMKVRMKKLEEALLSNTKGVDIPKSNKRKKGKDAADDE